MWENLLSVVGSFANMDCRLLGARHYMKIRWKAFGLVFSKWSRGVYEFLRVGLYVHPCTKRAKIGIHADFSLLYVCSIKKTLSPSANPPDFHIMTCPEQAAVRVGKTLVRR